MVTYLPSLNRPLTMANQVVLEEANDQESQNDYYYYSAIMIFGVTVNGLLALF